MPLFACEGQGSAFRSWLSHFPKWVSETESRFLGLEASTFICETSPWSNTRLLNSYKPYFRGGGSVRNTELLASGWVGFR